MSTAVVLDSDWEFELARVHRAQSPVVAYVKNQGLNSKSLIATAPCRADMSRFIVRIDDGGAEPLNLILETKGYRGADAQLKAETMKKLWVPGVNNLGTMGRWAFAEFTDVFEIQDRFRRAGRVPAPSTPAKILERTN